MTAFFTTRYGAVEGAPGGTVFDDPKLFAEMGLEDCFKVWPKQVHGTDIAVVSEDFERCCEENSGWIRRKGGVIIPATDGVITNVKNVLLTSVHADCLPVYLYDPEAGAIGLVHAGWRGAAAGIVPKAMGKMRDDFGAKAESTKLYIGPGISRCCFEVGGEVAAEFLEKWGSTFAEPVTDSDSLDADSKYMLDLKAAVRAQATGTGIQEDNIGVSSHCTCCEPELFCSYRREGGTYMRMGAGIRLV
ncbi:MAG: peptidoglycan editing factor PgeF [Bacillota bacterium]